MKNEWQVASDCIFRLEISAAAAAAAVAVVVVVVGGDVVGVDDVVDGADGDVASGTPVRLLL